MPQQATRAVMLHDDGTKTTFEYSEVFERVQDIIERSSTPEVAAKEAVRFMVKLCSGVKLTTKYKPWANEPKPHRPSASVYRKGFYDGWVGLQNTLRFELGVEE